MKTLISPGSGVAVFLLACGFGVAQPGWGHEAETASPASNHVSLASPRVSPLTPPTPNPLPGIALLQEPGKALPFRQFFRPGPREMKLAPELSAWQDQRVQLTGFMVKMEMPSTGSFYVTGAPLSTFEDGGGTGDLPPSAVRVLVRGAKGKLVDEVSGKILVTGRLQIGTSPEIQSLDPNGKPAYLNLIMDRPEDLTPPASSASKTAAPASSSNATAKPTSTDAKPLSKETQRNASRPPASHPTGADRHRISDVRGESRAAHR